MSLLPMTTMEAAAYCGIWFFVWGALTLVLLNRYERRKGDEWVSRVVSTLHALVSCTLAFVAVVDAFPSGWFGDASTFWEQMALGVSIGYFAVDFIGMWFGTYYDSLFLWHHVCSAWGLGIAHFSGNSGWELSVCLLFMEVSNPFLHGRWLLIFEDLEKSRFFWWCTELFWWSFTTFRISCGTPFAYLMISSPDVPWVLKFLGGAIMVFSWKFWLEMIGKRRRDESWK